MPIQGGSRLCPIADLENLDEFEPLIRPPLLVSQWSSLCRPSPPRLCIDPLASNRPPNHSAMIICSCNVLTDHDVRSTLSGAEGARTVGEVYDRLGCSVQCGRCARTIRRILNAVAAIKDYLALYPDHVDAIEERPGG